MKKSMSLTLAAFLILASCEKKDSDVFFSTGNGQEYKFRDIELYDSSTHILYFKTIHEEFDDITGGKFAFMDDGDIIYEGSFVPGYSSFIPSGPFIMSPSMYGKYALAIMNWYKPDTRNDPKLIAALSRHDLLHAGLSITAGSVEISGTQLTFTFTVTNNDQTNLLIIDPDKTGPALFHYFTNGLYIYDLTNKEVFSGNIEHQTPDPWNSWKIDWLSKLKSGDSKEFTIHYTINNPLPSGDYDATFEFPGLAYQVSIDQLYQGDSRVMLGDVSLRKRITVQ